MKIFLLFLFITGSSGIFTTCRFALDTWVTIGEVYACEVDFMDFSDNQTHLTGYNGTHLSGKTSDDVTAIYFIQDSCMRYNLTTIPKGMSIVFPNLIGMWYHTCPISNLVGDELDEYSKLEMWGLVNTNLSRVPGNFFKSTLNLKFVSFYNNQLQHVGEGLLNDLQDLELAVFINNICIDMTASGSFLISILIEALSLQCSDIDPETTTQVTTTTTPGHPERCFNNFIEVFICEIYEKNQKLHRMLNTLEDRVSVLEGFEDREILDSNRVEELEKSDAELVKLVKDLVAQNEILKANLEEQTRKIEKIEDDYAMLIQKLSEIN